MRRFFSALIRWPYRFLLAAAVIAGILCLFPVHVDAPGQPQAQRVAQEQAEDLPQLQGVAAGADLSERTQSGCALHRTLYYAPCGHSVQRREALPAALVGLSRSAMETELDGVIPGAKITGFSAQEVDIAVQADIPCPLHWVLAVGENGLLEVRQNVTGETLDMVRATDLRTDALTDEAREELQEGMIFDDVQTLEGYLENLSS